jgi:hypothetical protein
MAQPIVLVTIALDAGGNLTYMHNIPLLDVLGLLQHTLDLAERDWKAQQSSQETDVKPAV